MPWWDTIVEHIKIVLIMLFGVYTGFFFGISIKFKINFLIFIFLICFSNFHYIYFLFFGKYSYFFPNRRRNVVVVVE